MTTYKLNTNYFEEQVNRCYLDLEGIALDADVNDVIGSLFVDLGRLSFDDRYYSVDLFAASDVAALFSRVLDWRCADRVAVNALRALHTILWSQAERFEAHELAAQ